MQLVESLGDNKYCIRAKIGNSPKGNPITRSKRIIAKSENDAWKQQGKWEDDCKKLVGKQGIKSMTVAQFYDNLISGYSTKSVESSTKDYHRYMGKRLVEYLGNRPLKKVTTADIDSYMTALLNSKNVNTGKPLLRSGVKKHEYFVRFFFREAIKEGFIQISPCDGMMTLHKAEAEEAKIPTLEDAKNLKILMDKALQYNRITFYLMFYTGMRKEEALALLWSDIDFEKSVISITKARVFSQDEGYIIKPPKTKQSNRSVYMPDALKEILEKYKADRDSSDKLHLKKNATYNTKNLKYVIIEPDTGNLPGKDALRTWMTRNCKTVKINYYSPHKLRHFFATMAVSNGTDIKTAMAMLGHKDERMLLKIYSHAVSDQQKKASEIIGSVLEKI